MRGLLYVLITVFSRKASPFPWSCLLLSSRALTFTRRQQSCRFWYLTSFPAPLAGLNFTTPSPATFPFQKDGWGSWEVGRSSLRVEGSSDWATPTCNLQPPGLCSFGHPIAYLPLFPSNKPDISPHLPRRLFYTHTFSRTRAVLN